MVKAVPEVAADDSPAYVDYLSVVVGSTIMAISEEEHSVHFHMSGGHTMEVHAVANGSFAINIVLPRERH